MSDLQEEPDNSRRPLGVRCKRAFSFLFHHAQRHIGVGIVCSVAYFDPGNWGVDLQAGSQYGYHLLFVVLLAGICAAFLQVLACRLGCVTGVDLAYHCRLLLYNRPKHTKLYRYLGLYPLYILAEIAVIATDLAELLGSAIGLCLLFPKLELWHGVLLTAFDVVLILGLRDPLGSKPVKMFEVLIALMTLIVLICILVIILKVNVKVGEAFLGFLPSKYIFAQGGVYTSVGIIGATVMPHSLYLGSTLATQDRVNIRDKQLDLTVESPEPKASEQPSWLSRYLSECKEVIISAFRKPPTSMYASNAMRYCEHTNNSHEFVRAHLYHGTIDMIGSLLGFAVVINALILILASSVFYYDNPNGGQSAASLFDAYDLIRDRIGLPAAKIFAVALLFSGQSSSLIATVAGQAVCEGFLQWRVSPVVRRLFTRLLAIIPSMVVAIVVGRDGIDTLLVASQVVISIVLPFVLVPLLLCTSSKAIMSVKKTRRGTGSDSCITPVSPTSVTSITEEGYTQEEIVDYSNNKLTIIIGGIVWFVISAADVYALVQLGMPSQG